MKQNRWNGVRLVARKKRFFTYLILGLMLMLAPPISFAWEGEDGHTYTTCTLTIRSDIHTESNPAIPDGLCAGFVLGYYMPHLDEFALRGVSNYNLKENRDGQEFIIGLVGTQGYSRGVLTVYTIKVEPPKQEDPKQPPKDEKPTQPPKNDNSKEETKQPPKEQPKEETKQPPKEEKPKNDSPKNDPPKNNSPKNDSQKNESGKSNPQQTNAQTKTDQITQKSQNNNVTQKNDKKQNEQSKERQDDTKTESRTENNKEQNNRLENKENDKQDEEDDLKEVSEKRSGWFWIGGAGILAITAIIAGYWWYRKKAIK